MRASSEGLKGSDAEIEIAAAPAVPAVAALDNPPLVVLGWKRSPVSESRPDPQQQLLATDMNSWSDAHPGGWLPPFRNGRFAIYRVRFSPRSATQTNGGKLLLRDVVGKAQVWIDGKMVAERSTADKADISVPLSAATGEREVSVLIESAAKGESAGLGGVVTVE